MADSLVLHHIPASPNNIKVRIALAYKNIPYEAIPADRMDRSALIELSSQPLTPVIEHDGRVLFDSGAILRYLDANFPATPRIFSTDRDELRQIERWEAFHRTEIGGPLSRAFMVLFSGKENETIMARQSKVVHENTARLEEQLADREWLVGDRMTAADIVVASYLAFACFPPKMAAAHQPWQWFDERIDLGEGREKCRAHVARVLKYLSEAAD